jgi:hypothetical protein
VLDTSRRYAVTTLKEDLKIKKTVKLLVAKEFRFTKVNGKVKNLFLF